MWWKDKVTTLSGVGTKRASELENLGIRTVGDLLYFYPRQGAYLDYSKVKNIRDLALDGSKQIFRAKVVRVNPIRQGRRPFVTITVRDDTGFAELYFFGATRYWVRRFKVDDELLIIGRVKAGGVAKMVTPEMVQLFEGDVTAPGILPVYSLSGSLTQNMLRKWMKEALELAKEDLPETLPKWILERLKPLGRYEALQNIHFPENMEKLKRARQRFIFEELFLLQCGLLYYRADTVAKQAPNFGVNGNKVKAVIDGLPYELTSAQMKVWDEIAADLEMTKPMHRILQGDVGSGKTAVAALALAKAAESGYQGTIMAPTEILAHQHFETLNAYLQPAGFKVALLVGAMRSEARQQLLCDLADGKIDILVGTHALLQEDVVFKNLALVITDEQHRFGVEQRAKLTNKTNDAVHTLVMTATPIPRTLALTVYGDLDISRMEGRPPGRKQVQTLLYTEKDRMAVYGGVRHQAELGHQVYVVCPLIEDSELIDAKSAEQVYAEMHNSILRGINTAFIHGRMKAAEKEAIMQDFTDGKIAVLFSTTVIEVGVNVPNATLMVVENAERYGLAQLHQLRGRVGRGLEQSYCALMLANDSVEARERLEILTESDDGFYLAEQDLRLRGAGQLFGLKQHGLPDLHIADILRDTDIIILARKLAQECVQNKEGRMQIKELVQMQLDERFQGIFNN